MATRKRHAQLSMEEESKREELFHSDTPTPSLRQRRGQEQEAQNVHVTESLVELRQMMEGQLQQSDSTMRVLVPSSTKIREIKTGMDEIGSKIKVSQSLISKLSRRDVTDKLLIFLALVFFFGVVLYIIRKRLIGWII